MDGEDDRMPADGGDEIVGVTDRSPWAEPHRVLGLGRADAGRRIGGCA
jgi:hypothetical protein